MSPDRKELRAEILKQRRALPQDARIDAALQVTSRLFALDIFAASHLNVASYVAVRGELDTAAINRRLTAMGHTPVLPRVIPDVPGAMDLYACTDESCLVKGSFGIMEPDPQKAVLTDPQALDAVLLPLVAMDRRGNRLGMGGGYYDRLLKKLAPSCVKIGLGYDFQLLDEIEAEEWDMPLDLGIVSGGVLRFS